MLLNRIKIGLSYSIFWEMQPLNFSSLLLPCTVKTYAASILASWAAWDWSRYSVTPNRLNARRRMCFSPDPIPNYLFPPRGRSQVVQNGWIRLAEITSRQSARSVIGRNEYQVPPNDLSDCGFWPPESVMNRSEIWDLTKEFSCSDKSLLACIWDLDLAHRNLLFFVPCALRPGD